MNPLSLVVDIGALAAVYCLIALGFSMTYTVGRFFDLTQGAAFLVGGYLGYFFQHEMGWGIVPSFFISLVGAGLWGALVEISLIFHLRQRNATPLVCFIGTLGVLMFVESVVSLSFGSDIKVYRSGPAKVFDLGLLHITDVQMAQIGLCLLAVPMVLLLIRRTVFGRRLRAISDSKVLAETIGIPVDRVFIEVFILASTLSGMAGFIFAFDRTIDPTRGMFAVLSAIIAAIVGGAGKIPGAMMGALLLAAAETIVVTVLPSEWKHALVYTIFIAFLSLRPQGILGGTIREA